jgi:hypothetical protein
MILQSLLLLILVSDRPARTFAGVGIRICEGYSRLELGIGKKKKKKIPRHPRRARARTCRRATDNK